MKKLKKVLRTIILLSGVGAILLLSPIIKERIENPIKIIPPSIILYGNQEVKVLKGQKYQEEGYLAIDEHDGDITDKVVRSEQNDEINYEVKNSKGKITDIKRKIIYEEPIIDKKDEETKTISKQTNTINENSKEIQKESKGTIYLTFDDGPSKYTNDLLDILKENNVKATFFVTKSVKDYKDSVRRIINEGHTIALHTYSHDYKEVYSSVDAYINDLNRISDSVYDITGIKSKIFRFPGGSSNTVSLKYKNGVVTEIAKKLTKEGYVYFDWNISAEDATGIQNSSETITKNVIDGIHEQKEYVVLQHDTNKNSILAVKQIIKQAKEKGYVFDKITETVPVIHHGIKN